MLNVNKKKHILFTMEPSKYVKLKQTILNFIYILRIVAILFGFEVAEITSSSLLDAFKTDGETKMPSFV